MAFTRLKYLLGLFPFLFVTASIGESYQKGNSSEVHFDYVILGGGTAGLVIASRLSKNSNVTVVVIEAGDFEKTNPNVTSSTGLGLAKDTRVDWQYKSNTGLFGGNQSLVWSAGKGLGGSSLINGMTYMRPASSQIDLWPSLGLDIDWSLLLTAGKGGEHFTFPTTAQTELGAGYEAQDHGFAGPLTTCISPHMTTGDIHEVFNTTFKALGVPPRDEFCGGELRGFGVQAATQDAADDIREDSAHAYYYPVADRKNLAVLVNTTAARVIWASYNSAAGNVVAAGAEVIRQTGEVSIIYANRDVILSAGALRSPAILEQSGIGQPGVLADFSIDIKVDLPSVGENLQDQTTISILANAPTQNFTGFPAFVAQVSLSDLFGPNTTSFYQSALAKIQDYGATIAAQNGGGSNASTQERLLRSQLDLLYNSNTPAAELVPLGLGNLIGCIFWPLQPFSRGSVHINSTDPLVQPTITPNFFQLDFDSRMAVAAGRFSRKLLTTKPLVNLIDVSTMTPSFEDVPEDANDEVWLQWIKNDSKYQPNYHHLGTCAMLPQAMGGVVDNEFRVYGTENVRVVDLSVVPLQVAGHSTALLYAIAEWASVKITSNRNI